MMHGRKLTSSAACSISAQETRFLRSMFSLPMTTRLSQDETDMQLAEALAEMHRRVATGVTPTKHPSTRSLRARTGIGARVITEPPS